MTAIDYAALAERIEYLAGASYLSTGEIADLRTVATMLRGMAKQEPVGMFIDVTTNGESTGRYELAAREYWGDPDLIPLYLHPQPATPPGYRLVPIEPTPEMERAGGHANSEWLNDSAPIGEKRYAMPMKSVWRDMLDAAPQEPDWTTEPPAPGGPYKTAEELFAALNTQPQEQQRSSIADLERICAESYQVVGWLASECGLFDHEQVIKALDNLSEQRLVHDDVLPFNPQRAQPQEQRKPRTGKDSLSVAEPTDHTEDTLAMVPTEAQIESLAHEVWAAAQTVPGEGIQDAVDRIVERLRAALAAKE